jgi:membrane-associated phospholipid phosphatase
MEQLDHAIFFFINHTLHFSLLDDVLPYWRSMYFWIPFYAFLIAYLTMNFGKKGWIYLLAVVLTIAAADQMSSRVIKKTVKRVRPCNDENLKTQVKLLVRCGSGYSFTSSHAANHFAVAFFLILTLFKNHKNLKTIVLCWAASVAIGQVYVGVHYPSDILGGAILGGLIGWGMAFLYKKYLKKTLTIYE